MEPLSFDSIKQKVIELRRDVSTCPRWVKLVVALGAFYLLSPIDLIPDFIPVIGHLDDLALLGFLVALVKKHKGSSSI